jgi:prevent-host-death family protein
MDHFSIRDLRDRSGELVRELEAGHLALITKHGKPIGVTVPMSEHLLETGVAMAIAIELFKGELISLGLAAKIARVSYVEFVEALGRLRIPVINCSPQELEQELKLLE